MIYLGSPYTHPDMAVRWERYVRVLRTTALLISQGEAVYSPIVHSMHIALMFPDMFSQDSSSWRQHNMHMVACSQQVYALMLNGWRESVGLTDEIIYSKAIGLPVHGVNEEGGIQCRL